MLIKRFREWRADLNHLLGQGFISYVRPKAWYLEPFGAFLELMSNYQRIYDWKADRFAANPKEKTLMFYPPIWIKGGGLSTIDPVLVKHILKDQFDTYVKTKDTVLTLKDLLGHGIFAVSHGPHSEDNGETWKIQRKTASKIFTNNNFTSLIHDTFMDHALVVGNVIDAKIGAGQQGVVELQSLMFKYTLDSIGKVGFGVDIGSLSQDKVPFATAFDRAQTSSAYRFLTPGWNIPVVGKMLYQNERLLTDSIKILDDFVYDIIARRKKEIEVSGPGGDILSLFMAEKLDLSDKELRDVVMSFAIAGRDTTACTLSFSLMLLAQNPTWQEALRREVRQILGDRDDRFPTVPEMGNMKILNGVVLESLRLYPPVPMDLKEAAIDDVLPDGRTVTKGTRIVFEVFVMGRSETLWHEPLKFDPDRWSRMEKLPSPYEFPQFQAGPRICLGETFAKHEARTLIAYLIDRYELSLPAPDSVFTYAPGITLTVKDGLNLMVKRISAHDDA